MASAEVGPQLVSEPALQVAQAGPTSANGRPTALHAVLDSSTLKRAYSCFPSGVVSICAHDGAEPIGIVASSFTAVSIDPPLVAFCIQNDSTTWPKLEALPRLGLSILGESHALACRQLARKNGDRFGGLNFSTTDEGAIFIDGASAAIDCSLEDQLPAGDHRIVLLRVISLSASPTVAPLIFHASNFGALRQVPA
jgi:flavin reductase (DIM6/NTAB) family NADH-FMN oxidoreductase RutF